MAIIPSFDEKTREIAGGYPGDSNRWWWWWGSKTDFI